MSKTTPPQIESLKFSELVIDPLYSGRDEKEIKANAKELAPHLADGWDAAQPGQYFVGEDGKKHLVAGFTRVAAAQLNELKSGFFVATDGDEIHHLTACIRTNQGKPISRKAQGERFIALRDGVVADDFAGAVADPANDSDWKRKPMTLDEIAALPGVGKTKEHIKQCILVAEDPVFAEHEDSISVNAFIAARNLVNRHHDGSNTKLAKVIGAAVRNAHEDGKEVATPKHFDAIKSDFIPEKKLVAAPVVETAANTDTEPATEIADAAPESPVESSADETDANEPIPVLFKDAGESSPAKTSPKLRKALETLLLELSDELQWAATDEDVAVAAERIEGFFAKAGEVF